MNLKNKIISLFTFILIVIITWLVLDNKNKIPTYWSYGINIPSTYNLLGLDVSHHQGDIYWDEVDKMSIDGDSISFVFLKASEGEDLVDDKFATNAESLNLRGIPFGSYHYYHPSKSAKKQAEFFCSTIKESSFTLRPVIDIELQGELTNEQLADSLLAFMRYVENELEVRPLIYTYESFYEDYLSETKVNTEDFWIASYNESCQLFQKENFLCWQFSETGTVNGISTKVDLNIAKDEFFEKVLR